MARGKYKGPKRGAGQRNRSTQDEEEDAFRASQGAGQATNVGEMPPDSSDEEEDDAAPAPEQKVVVFGGGMGAPGDLPPNSSSEEDDSDSDDGDVHPHGIVQADPPRRRKKDDDEDPAQIAKDLERLKLIKEKREKERQERIKREGWDRYAPLSETNKPPDGRPSDHPDFRNQEVS